MSPVTHFLAGWAVANCCPLSPRNRALVTLAGVIPDLDGFGLVAEVATRHSAHPLTWWSDYHHVLCHNLGFATLVSLVVLAVARGSVLPAALACASFHLHLLCDILGARGPDGHQWPIPYLQPFSTRWQIVWSGQWLLNGWQNIALTSVLLGLALYWAWKRGYSPLEMVSRRADQAVVAALRHRFPPPS